WSDAGALAHLIAPKSNTTYRARFSTPFTPVQGTYTGVFFETNGVQQQSSGGVSLTITDRGTLSGFLRLGSSRLRLAGQLDLAGHATLTSSSISVRLIVDLTGVTDRVSGSVGNGIWVASLDAVRAG